MANKGKLDLPGLLVHKMGAGAFIEASCRETAGCNSIRGLVVEYIVAIDVTRVRFLADAHGCELRQSGGHVIATR